MLDTEFLITRPADQLSELFQEKPLYRAKRLEAEKQPIWIGEYYSLIGGTLKTQQSFLDFLKERYTTQVICVTTTVQIIKDCICAKQLDVPNDTNFVQLERTYFVKGNLIGLEKIFVDTEKQAFSIEE